jgi:hypothetical protein
MKINGPVFKKTIRKYKSRTIVQRKVAIYSHATMIVLRYLQLTNPKFSRSKAAREILIEHAKENYSDMWDLILSEIPYNRITEETVSEWQGKKTQLDNPKIDKLSQAYSEILGNNTKIITIYSPQLSALYTYLDNTTPRFSASSYGAKILEDKIAKDHPGIWNKVQKQLTK